MAVTMVRLLTLLPGDAGTCRVIEFNSLCLIGINIENNDLEDEICTKTTFNVSNYHLTH